MRRILHHMDEMSDVERLAEFSSEYEQLKVDVQHLSEIPFEQPRMRWDRWRVIITRQARIEELYPSKTDPKFTLTAEGDAPARSTAGPY